MTDRSHDLFFFFSSRRRHTRLQGDWSSDVCSSDLATAEVKEPEWLRAYRFGLASMPVLLLLLWLGLAQQSNLPADTDLFWRITQRSEERRVGKEGRSRWSPYH